MAKSKTDTTSVLKLVIDGKQANTSIKELRDTYYKLNTEVNNLKESDNPAEYKKKVQDLQKVKQAWDSVRQEINGTTKEVNSFKSQIKDLAKSAVAGLSVAGLTYGIVNGVKTFVSKNAELSDSYGRVMKTTGLTEEAVDRLNDKFKKLDTRTANAELLRLAEVAGKIGRSAEKDVEGFVRAADKIGVALGEDLGGVEESINSLGKLVDIFKVKDQYGLEDSLIKVGSAINTLGASGTANEKNLVDFANRMAGIAPAANISLPAVLGLAAVQDELGQSMESSSTAIGQFIVGMGEDIPKFAKIAKMSVGDFATLLRTDANEALLRVLENSKSAGGGVASLAKNMKAIDVEGARGIQALGAMADNIDLVRQRQKESNDAFTEGTSVLAEFDTMNNNLAANLDKIGNKIDNLWQNSSLRSWFTDLTASILDNRTEFEKLVSGHNEAKKSFEELESSLNGNIKRYEELSTKTSLSTSEHTELQKLILQLSKDWPIAVTELDKYGNAMGINTSIIKDNIEAHALYLKQLNKTAIEEGRVQKATQERYKAQLENEIKSKSIQAAGPTGNLFTRNLSNEELKQKIEELNRVNDGITAIGYSLNLLGDGPKVFDTSAMNAHSQSVFEDKKAIEERIKVLKEEQKSGNLSAQRYKEVSESIDTLTIKLKGLNKIDGPTSTAVSKTKADEDVEKKAQKKADDELKKATENYQKLTEATSEFGVDQLALQLSQNEKEIAQEHKKYEDKIKAWQDYKNVKGATAEQQLNADGQIALLEVQQDEAVNALRVKQAQDASTKIEDLRASMAVRHAAELEKEKVRINKFYDDLEKANGDNVEVLAQLREDRAKDISSAVIREEDRIKAETERIRNQTIDFEANKYDNRIAKIKSAYALELVELESKFALELQSTEAFEIAKAALKAKYGAQEKQVELDRENDIKDLKLTIATSLSDAFFSIAKQNRDAELSYTLDKLEKQRANELANKNLTEAQKQAINDKYDRIARKEKLRAWQADKKASILQAIINTALAVTKALPNLFLAAAAGASGAAQVAVIASQKPPVFAKGGFIPQGPSHVQGGLNIYDKDNRIIANMEGGEPVLSRNTYANNREIVDALIYSGQRKQGASIGINPQLMDSSVYAATPSAVSNPIINVQSPSVDNTELVRAIGQLVNERIDRIQVEMSYHMFEDHQKKVATIRDSVNS